jgi:PAS domain S-box-containing protein
MLAAGRAFAPYLLASAAIVAALAVRWLLHPLLGFELPAIELYVVVALAVWYGGWRPALLASALGYVGAYFLFIQREPGTPLHLPAVQGFAGLLIYALFSLTIIVVGHKMRAARRRAEEDASRMSAQQKLLEREVAERRRTEETLRAKETELKLIADHTPVILSRCSRDLHFVSMNRACAEFLQVSQEEVAGRRFEDVVGKAAYAVLAPYIEQVLQGKAVDFEALVPYAAAGLRFMRATYTPDVDERGKVVGWIASLSDITARKKAEQTVIQRERLFRALVHASSQVVWHFRSDGQSIKEIDEASAAWWREFTGQTEQQRTAEGGTGWLEAVHPEDREIAMKCWQTVASSDAPVTSECRVRRHDGAWRWLKIDSVPIEGVTAGAESAGAVVDITERKEAGLALRESEHRFRTVVDASMVPFALFGPVRDEDRRIVDFRWQYVNAAATRLLQKDADALIGRRVENDFPGAWGEPGLFEGYVSVISNQQSFQTELRASKGGSWFRIIATPLEDAVAVWFADITERKRQEHALQDADRRKDEFLATLAHELRNPLAPIRQAALIARNGQVSDTQRLWAHSIIERQVQHMSLLLDDLLDVSRITRGTLSLRKQVVALRTIVNSAVETARPLIDSRNHVLEVEVPAGLQLEADPLRLSQILANLLTNAAKYTPHGGRIRLRAQVEQGAAVVRVEDTGIGLAPEDMQRIFEMFSQADSSSESVHAGLGIGLALSKGLVELHGGAIEAHSGGPGTGSEFVVRVPLGEVRTAPAPTRLHDRDPRHGAGRRILVADDNRDAAESLAVLLRLEGHEVMVADDGQAALRLFDEQHPEVALLDIGMPQMDGYEVARRIRSSMGGKRVLLVALTGWGQEKDRAASREAGFDHHLVKPVETEAISRLMEPPRREAAIRS